MYYNRTLSNSFSKLLEPNGSLRWLFDYVKNNPELDFLIGKNKSREWISVYRGLSRVMTILKTKRPEIVKLDGAEAYKKIANNLYGNKNVSENFCDELSRLVKEVSTNAKFDRYYNNKKEGYFQNELSRKFGICGELGDDFAIVDKEAVIGYENLQEKENKFGKIQPVYKELQGELSRKYAKRFGKNLAKKAIGNELDFLALDKQGNLLLIEYKHGGSTSGIYLSPLQIGMYYDLFLQIKLPELAKSVNEMIDQRKKIGLINSQWKTPEIKKVVPILIISEYNVRSIAKIKYQEVMDFVRIKKGSSFLADIKTYNYTSEDGLRPW